MTIPLGSTVRDTISGLEGVVTGRSEYLYTTPQVLLTPKTVNEGVPVAGTWLDEKRVTITSGAQELGFRPPADLAG